MSFKIALQGEDTRTAVHVVYQPRVCSNSLSGSLEMSRPRMASPKLFAGFEQLHRIVDSRSRP